MLLNDFEKMILQAANSAKKAYQKTKDYELEPHELYQAWTTYRRELDTIECLITEVDKDDITY